MGWVSVSLRYPTFDRRRLTVHASWVPVNAVTTRFRASVVGVGIEAGVRVFTDAGGQSRQTQSVESQGRASGDAK